MFSEGGSLVHVDLHHLGVTRTTVYFQSFTCKILRVIVRETVSLRKTRELAFLEKGAGKRRLLRKEM